MVFLLVTGVCLLLACIIAPLLRNRESETAPSEDLLPDPEPEAGEGQEWPFLFQAEGYGEITTDLYR